MGQWRVAVFLFAAVACGRIRFEPIGDPGDARGDGVVGDLGDASAAVPASCEMLPATCGPAGTSPCCESLVVPAGMFFRTYDVGTDNQFQNMSFPATLSAFRLDRFEVTNGRDPTSRFLDYGVRCARPAS